MPQKRCDQNCLECKLPKCIHDIDDEKYEEIQNKKHGKTEVNRIYYNKHKAKINEKNRKFYQEHREEMLARATAYYYEHKEEIAKKRKAKYDALRHKEVLEK